MKTKTLSFLAAAAMATSVAGGVSSTASASPVIQINLGPHCIYIGPKASTNLVRFKAAQKGFYGVQTLKYVARRYGPHCGVYRSVGTRAGVKYVLLSSVQTGDLVYARALGVTPGGFKVPGYVITQKATAMGYKNLHMLKFSAFSQRYTVRGYKKIAFQWVKYRLTFSRTGAYLGRHKLSSAPTMAPGFVIKNKASMMGYTGLHMLKYHSAVQRYTIRGYKKFGLVTKKFVLSFTKTGAYLGRTVIGTGTIGNPKAQVKFKAAAMGYKNLHALKYHPFTQRYTIEGYKRVFGVWRQFRLTFTKNAAYVKRAMI